VSAWGEINAYSTLITIPILAGLPALVRQQHRRHGGQGLNMLRLPDHWVWDSWHAPDGIEQRLCAMSSLDGRWSAPAVAARRVLKRPEKAGGPFRSIQRRAGRVTATGVLAGVS
jgi:hypothetical protein